MKKTLKTGVDILVTASIVYTIFSFGRYTAKYGTFISSKADLKKTLNEGEIGIIFNADRNRVHYQKINGKLVRYKPKRNQE